MPYTVEISLICSYCGEQYTINKEFEDKNKGLSWSKYIAKSKNSMCSACYQKQLLMKIGNCEQAFSLPTVKGKSEKQITFARKLRYNAVNNNIRIIDAFKSMYDFSKLSDGEIKLLAQNYYELIKYTLISDSAKDIIEHLKNI